MGMLLPGLVLAVFCNKGYGQADSGQAKQRPETSRIAAPVTLPKTQRNDTAAQATQHSLQQNTAGMASAPQHMQDSLRQDSLAKTRAAVMAIDTTTYRKYETHPGLAMNQPAVYRLTEYKIHTSKDELFYLMAGVLFFLAFVKAGFSRYFRNLFVLFFRTSLRQKQTRDQLLQDNFASLLMNVLFFISAGLYITLLIQEMGWSQYSFWILAAASAITLLLIYVGKYLFLLFSGWVFNAREAAGSYIFMVFMVNKVMGVALVPFLLLLSFATPQIAKHSITVSFAVIGILFIYRYFVSFTTIRSRLRVNVFHFLLYLCSVEILPLLLIYKLLLNYFNGSL
jgi:hypothetical protein